MRQQSEGKTPLEKTTRGIKRTFSPEKASLVEEGTASLQAEAAVQKSTVPALLHGVEEVGIDRNDQKVLAQYKLQRCWTFFLNGGCMAHTNRMGGSAHVLFVPLHGQGFGR